MRIVLTGGTGMVGKNFLEHPDTRTLSVFAPGSRDLDLRDFSAVLKYLRHYSPDFVIHAAGRVGGIQANIKEPVGFLLDNLDMGRNIVWAARQAGIRKLINLGSSCMYPRNARNPLSEEMVLQGELEPTNEGYALAKVTVARLCEYITRESPEFQYKTIIPCNLYGRWDKFDPAHSHMIPAVIKKLHDAKISGEKKVLIWGDGTARREFMYSSDFADCLVTAIRDFDRMPGLMNTGIGYDHSINEYYKAIAEAVGYTGAFEHDLSKPVGMKQKVVNIERQTRWGWKAPTPLSEGLAATYRFFLDTLKG